MEFWALVLLYRLLPLSDLSSVIAAPLCFGFGVAALAYAVRGLLAARRGQAVWVDSTPFGLVNVGRVQVNGIPLVFGAIALFSAGKQLVEANAQSGLPIPSLFLDFALTGVFIVLAFLRFQIRQKGILTYAGRLIPWTAIQHYEWVKYKDRVKLQIHQWPRGLHTVTVDVPKDLRAAVGEHLAQHVGKPEAGN